MVSRCRDQWTRFILGAIEGKKEIPVYSTRRFLLSGGRYESNRTSRIRGRVVFDRADERWLWQRKPATAIHRSDACYG